MANKRLIDANEALEQVCKTCCCDFEECKRIGFCADYKNIERLPTVDAVEVVHGEWVDDTSFENIVCTECGHMWNTIDNCTETFNYCPNCGADMRGTTDGKE